jgi:hypothetical protein
VSSETATLAIARHIVPKQSRRKISVQLGCLAALVPRHDGS